LVLALTSAVTARRSPSIFKMRFEVVVANVNRLPSGSTTPALVWTGKPG
jgi:hypothetical protein